jgi:hypothetical protein
MTATKWKTYKEFINEVQDKSPNEVNAVINEYFPSIQSSSIPKRFHFTVMEMFKHKISDADGLEVLPKLYKVYTTLYPNLKTRRQTLSEIRRKFILKYQSKKLYLESQKDAYFNIDMNERIGINETYIEKITEQNKDKLQVDLQHVLDTMRQLILSKNVYERGLCLLLAGGMRPIELFYRNEVETIEDMPNWIRVSNLAKKRDGESQQTTRPIVMLSANQFIAELQRFRKHFKGKSVKVVDPKTGSDKLAADKSQTMNKIALKHFPFLKDLQQQSSLMRKIYVDMSFTMFADPKKTNYNSWVSEKLGHSGLLTSFSYSWVSVRNKEEIKETELYEKITMLEQKLDLLVAMNEKQVMDHASLRDPVEEEKEPYITVGHIPKARESDEEKLKRLEQIWEANPKISNISLRKKAKLGSKLVNSFMKSKKKS